jgi:hypothetical protein
VITTEVVLTTCRRGAVDCLSSIVRANRTVEGALDQVLWTESSGIIGIQFRSALRALWHLDQNRNSHFKPSAQRL